AVSRYKQSGDGLALRNSVSLHGPRLAFQSHRLGSAYSVVSRTANGIWRQLSDGGCPRSRSTVPPKNANVRILKANLVGSKRFVNPSASTSWAGGAGVSKFGELHEVCPLTAAWWDDAELLKQAKHIELDPLFRKLATRYAVDFNAGKRHLLASRRNA